LSALAPVLEALTILIAEDSAADRLLLASIIRRQGHQVLTVSNGAEAIEVFARERPQLVLMDPLMPVRDGFEAARQIRQGYESGAVDFLHKPLDIHAVKSKVNVFVDLYRQSKAMKLQVEELERSRREQELLLTRLQATQAELEQAVRMRDDFMSIVAHEVRTPLNGLILETQLRKMHLARDNAAAFTLDKMHAMVDRDERQIQSLIRLIEDMLDVSRIRTGKLSIRPARIDLAQLVRNLVDNFAPQVAAAESSMQLQAESPVQGCWDEFRIEQVITNLLTNALRYGAKSPVQVRVYTEHGEARVEVRDHGIGISEENQKRIFQQFERVSANHSAAGLGLGLFISEQIVAAHGGTIEVESQIGEGALFRVCLPLEVAE